MTTRRANPPGTITAGELYTLDAVKRRLGIGDKGLRACRRRGLPVRRIGNRRLVLGDELIDWVRRNEPSDECAPGEPDPKPVGVVRFPEADA